MAHYSWKVCIERPMFSLCTRRNKIPMVKDRKIECTSCKSPQIICILGSHACSLFPCHSSSICLLSSSDSIGRVCRCADDLIEQNNDANVNILFTLHRLLIFTKNIFFKKNRKQRVSKNPVYRNIVN